LTELEKRRHRCCFVDDRQGKLCGSDSYVKKRLREEIDRALRDGYTTFVTGMAEGLDLWGAMMVLEEKRLTQTVHLIAAIPYPGYPYCGGNRWASLRQTVFRQADLLRFIAQEYEESCFQQCGEWIIDRCSRAIVLQEDCVATGQLRYADEQCLQLCPVLSGEGFT